MGGQGEQWLLVRNERGEELLALLGDEVRSAAPGSAGKRRGAVTGFLANIERAAGGLPLRGMPNWLRPLVGWLMPRVGPRGLEFARARVEMKAMETILHLRREQPRRLRHMVPAHVWALVAPYGLTPTPTKGPQSGNRQQEQPETAARGRLHPAAQTVQRVGNPRPWPSSRSIAPRSSARAIRPRSSASASDGATSP